MTRLPATMVTTVRGGVRSQPRSASQPTSAAATRKPTMWPNDGAETMSLPPEPSANQGTHGVRPRARYSTIPARARRQPRAAAPSSTAKVWPVIGTGVNGSLTASWAASPVKAANPATRTASRTRSPGSTSASTRRRGWPRALCDTDTGGSFLNLPRDCARRCRLPGRPMLRCRGAPPRRPPELGEAPLPARLVPVAALGGLPLRPDHHMQGAGEDLLLAAGAAVHLGRPVGLHEAEVPAVGHPLQSQRLAPEPPRGLHRRHGPSVRNRRRLVAADEPLRGRHRPRAAAPRQGPDPQRPRPGPLGGGLTAAGGAGRRRGRPGGVAAGRRRPGRAGRAGPDRDPRPLRPQLGIGPRPLRGGA